MNYIIEIKSSHNIQDIDYKLLKNISCNY